MPNYLILCLSTVIRNDKSAELDMDDSTTHDLDTIFKNLMSVK